MNWIYLTIGNREVLKELKDLLNVALPDGIWSWWPTTTTTSSLSLL